MRELQHLMGIRAYNLARIPGETRNSKAIYKALMLAHAYGASYDTSLKALGFL